MPWSDLYHYWRSKHVRERPPSRKEIDPLIEIPGLLANVMLIDIEPAGYRNRLIGSTITRRLGRNDAGKLIDGNLFGPVSLAVWRELMDKVTLAQEPQLVTVRVAPNESPSLLTIMLPLVGRRGETEMIISGCFFDNLLQAPRQPIPLVPTEVRVPYDEPIMRAAASPHSDEAKMRGFSAH